MIHAFVDGRIFRPFLAFLLRPRQTDDDVSCGSVAMQGIRLIVTNDKSWQSTVHNSQASKSFKKLDFKPGGVKSRRGRQIHAWLIYFREAASQRHTKASSSHQICATAVRRKAAVKIFTCKGKIVDRKKKDICTVKIGWPAKIWQIGCWSEFNWECTIAFTAMVVLLFYSVGRRPVRPYDHMVYTTYMDITYGIYTPCVFSLTARLLKLRTHAFSRALHPYILIYSYLKSILK